MEHVLHGELAHAPASRVSEGTEAFGSRDVVGESIALQARSVSVGYRLPRMELPGQAPALVRHARGA